MKLDVRAVAAAGAVAWGVLAMLLTGAAHLIWPGYGRGFLDVMDSLYPGYDPDGGWAHVVVGALYGVVDGAVAGAVFAWLYNRFVRA